MKLFMAGFDTETNTFSPLLTGHRSFEEGFIAHGDATRQPANYCSDQLLVWRRRAEERGWAVAEGLCTFAEPGGTIVQPVYEAFRDEILSDLERARPVDVVLLALHGAMVARGCDDCEGDILERVRRLVGPEVVVGAELDLHCHITPKMVENATLLVTYKEYPHIDIPARAEDLFRLAADAAEGRTRPAMAAFDCRMIGSFRTTEQPMRGFVDRMIEREGRDGVLSLSLGHSFPWGDVAEVGARTIAIVDGDAAKAERVAAELGREFFGLRQHLMRAYLGMDEALDQALAEAEGPVVIADVADNPGGGAPSDATFFLARMLERGIRNAASGYYWDPLAVRFCQEAGVGTHFTLRLGGKCGRSSGAPLDLEVTVRGLADQVSQRFGEAPVPMGASAWVETEGIDLVLTSLRTQVFHPEGMSKLGLGVSSRKMVIVKSTQHFHAGFAPVARRILYAAAPGALQPAYDRVPYTKMKRPYWPKVEDPFAGG